MEKVFNIIKDISKARFNHLVGKDIFEILHQDNIPKLRGHQTIAITVQGSETEVVIYLFIKPDEALAFTANTLKKDQTQFDQKVVLDFFKELCNLIAGGIKSQLLSYEIDTTISLPRIETEFVEYSQQSEHQQCWKLVGENHSFICCAKSKVDPISTLEKIVHESGFCQDADETGDIEFL